MDKQDKNTGNSKKTNPSDDQQPGPSQPKSTKQTLVDYLAENMEALKNEEMYAVVPLKYCPHLSTLDPNTAPKSNFNYYYSFYKRTIDKISFLDIFHFFSGIDTKSKCKVCESTAENWICLSCYQTFCGRYIQEHMLFHHLETEHPFALSFSDLSIWCYKCDAYLDNAALYKYKNLAHLDKFGEELVWSYGNDTENVILLS